MTIDFCARSGSRTHKVVALKLIIRRKASLISNQILVEFVAVLKDWKVIFDSNPVASDYIYG